MALERRRRVTAVEAGPTGTAKALGLSSTGTAAGANRQIMDWRRQLLLSLVTGSAPSVGVFYCGTSRYSP
jgi:hypothetical protein